MSNLFVMAIKQDPTRTTTLRKQYESDLVRRFNAMIKLIEQVFMDSEPIILATNAPRKFKFEPKAEKIDDFMDWLRQQERKEILEVQYGTPQRKASSSSWQNVYLKRAYKQGVNSAAQQLRKGGTKVKDTWVDASFDRPMHADRVGIIYSRAYGNLEGITSAMDKQISAALATGVSQGLGMAAISKLVVDRVKKVGIARARVLARTEVINAHAEASLNSYEEAGIEGVNVQSEFATAQDNKVCPKCEKLEGRTYSIKSARSIIPVHPNCRCAWLPVVKSPGRTLG